MKFSNNHNQDHVNNNERDDSYVNVFIFIIYEIVKNKFFEIIQNNKLIFFFLKKLGLKNIKGVKKKMLKKMKI